MNQVSLLWISSNKKSHFGNSIVNDSWMTQWLIHCSHDEQDSATWKITTHQIHLEKIWQNWRRNSFDFFRFSISFFIRADRKKVSIVVSSFRNCLASSDFVIWLCFLLVALSMTTKSDYHLLVIAESLSALFEEQELVSISFTFSYSTSFLYLSAFDVEMVFVKMKSSIAQLSLFVKRKSTYFLVTSSAF